jgi:stage III sporulation protein SpoIIIAA
MADSIAWYSCSPLYLCHLDLTCIPDAGVGKTTAIRDLARLLAGECKKRVVIVDTSNEIGGDGDVPHPGIGHARRMQVSSMAGCWAGGGDAGEACWNS